MSRPTGIRDRTSRLRLKAVLTAVDFTDGQGTPDIAARLGISWATANRYLLLLEEEGKIKVQHAERGRGYLWSRCD